MSIETTPASMSSQEIVALAREHTFFSWSVQGALDPIAIDRAEGVYLYTPEGRRILDFNSQLMSVNIGHGDRRVIDAITAQATKLQYVQPAFATEIRARLGAKLAEILPGDLDKVFFTLGGAEAIENAIKLARHATGQAQDPGPLSLVPRRDDGRDDPDRRPAPLGQRAGHRRASSATRTRTAGARPSRDRSRRRCRVSRTSSATRARTRIAAIFLETIVGTNGILIPPDGYIAGVREICDRHGILMVADEVMAGFGRTGNWFAVDDWDVTPDLMTMAKGLTSSYLPLGRRRDAPRHRRAVRDEDVLRRPHLQQPPGQPGRRARHDLGLRGGRPHRDTPPDSGPIMRGHHERLAAKHPSVGATRNLGLFGIIDLVRSHDPWTPMTPFNGTSDEMKAVGKYLRDNDVYTMIANNSIHTNPPLCITEEQLAEGFDVIDRALDIADEAVKG